MNLNRLLSNGKEAATYWRDVNDQLDLIQDSGSSQKYDHARELVQHELTKQALIGEDLSVFQGKDSPFIFPEEECHIVVRMNRIITPHTKLETIQEKIDKKKLELKKLEADLKAEQQKLLIDEKVQEIVEKVSLQFRNYKKWESVL